MTESTSGTNKTRDAARPKKKGPMTASDYARTTTGSPADTAVIPAVQDSDAGRPPQPTAADAAGELEPVGRQARLRLVHVEPWSVTRLAFVVSVALMIVSVVAVFIFWLVFNVTGVWDELNDAINAVLSSDTSSFDISEYLGLGRLLGVTLVLSAVNVVLMTALAAVGAHLYNAAAQLLGGVEVTFSDR